MPDLIGHLSALRFPVKPGRTKISSREGRRNVDGKDDELQLEKDDELQLRKDDELQLRKDDELQLGMSGRLELTYFEILLNTSLIWPRNPKRTKRTTLPQSAL